MEKETTTKQKAANDGNTMLGEVLYHIVSLKWTHKSDDWITFYRHNSNGYCWRKDWTGEFENPNVDGYNEIKIEVDKLKDLWVKDLYDGEEILVIPNNRRVRDILDIKVKNLKRKYPSH